MGKTLIDINNLDKYFVKADLIPAIVQDIENGEVLMLAYMNKESLKLTLETGYTWFYSRSRQELWNSFLSLIHSLNFRKSSRRSIRR